MRKIIVSNFMSLDGYLAGPGGEIDWFLWSDEVAEFMKSAFVSIDTILFGRVTYELMAGYWPKATSPAEDPAIIQAMNGLPKVVFSKTLAKADWKNTTLVRELKQEDIPAMKGQPGKDMVIFGSSSLVSQLGSWAQIDEYRIFVNPVILGKGKPEFPGFRDPLKLRFLEARTFKSGLVLLRYAPAPAP